MSSYIRYNPLFSLYSHNRNVSSKRRNRGRERQKHGPRQPLHSKLGVNVLSDLNQIFLVDAGANNRRSKARKTRALRVLDASRSSMPKIRQIFSAKVKRGSGIQKLCGRALKKAAYTKSMCGRALKGRLHTQSILNQTTKLEETNRHRARFKTPS